jgi:hypothetical protein
MLFIAAALCLWTPARPATAQNAMAPASPPAVDRTYLDGRLAFMQGRDQEAADLLMQAVRTDWHCLAVMRDPRFPAALPDRPCAEVEGLNRPSGGEDPGPEALYRLGLMRKAAAREQKLDEVLVRREGEYFLKRLVKEYQSSAWADDAALLLTEDGCCVVDEGYPSCTAWEIRGYEQWLGDYGASDLRPGVLRKLTSDYRELARRYDEPGAWNDPVKAELCRGHALQLATVLSRERPGTAEAGWGRDTAREIRDSGKAYSMVPRSVMER